MFSQTKLMKLRSMAEESMWSAARLVEERKDLVFDGVVSNLDEIANLLADCADNAFAEREENEKNVRAALKKTEGVLAQIEAIIKTCGRSEQVKRIVAIGRRRTARQNDIEDRRIYRGSCKGTRGRKAGERVIHSDRESRLYALLQFFS